MTLALSLSLGILAAFVGVLAAWLLHKLNARLTQGIVAQYRPQQPPERYSVAQLRFAGENDPGYRPMPVQAFSGVSPRPLATEWRRYGYEVPTRQRTYRRNRLLGDAAAGAPIVETMTPARQQDLRSDVGVPIGQSLFSAFVAMLVGAVIAWRLHGDILLWGVMGGVGGLALMWMLALGLARQLVWRVERFIGEDLDGDGVPGEPETYAMIENPGRAREEVAGLTEGVSRRASTAAMLSFWQKCVNVGTSTRDHGARPGTKALEDYEAARDVLIQLGLAQWHNEANHRAGWDVTTDLATGARIIGQHVRTMRQTRHN